MDGVSTAVERALPKRMVCSDFFRTCDDFRLPKARMRPSRTGVLSGIAVSFW
jgi:hypothetical protein